MESAVALWVTAIIGLVFGFLGLVASVVTGTIVIGWKSSTHRIVQVPTADTQYALDLPPGVTEDQLPSPPEPVTAEQWARRQRDASFDEVYGQIDT